MSDPRFARLRTDPRFRKPKKNQQKVVVDDRFKSIFEDDKKGAKKKSKSGHVDKYGRHVSDSHEKDNLRRFYRLEGEEEEKSETPPKVLDYARGEVLLESSDEEDETGPGDPASDDDGEEVVLGRHASKPIPVPGEEEHLEIDLNEDDDAYADLDAQAAAYAEEHAEDETEGSGSKTNRLAVVNLDWDHVRASHLYRIFSSLVSSTAPSFSVATGVASSAKGKKKSVPSGAKVIRGKVLSVRVYPSEFGKERMRREEAEGPPKEIFKKSRRDDDDNLDGLIQEDEGDEYDENALRKYQLERLRYYYAVVTCDTVDAATHLLSELDGTELERSANVFDLSFVPDDMSFDDEFREEATPATESAGTAYKGLDFSTDALRHSKVTLKWDEDDTERNKITRKALSRKEIEEGDYRAYIASSGSEDEDEGKGEEAGKGDREKLRKLLLGGGGDGIPEGWGGDPFNNGEDGEDGDMEITFMPGLSEANTKDGDETTLEAYKRKQKEKRQLRKQERKEQPEGKKKTEGKKAKGLKDDFFDEDSESDDGDAVDDPKKAAEEHIDRSESPVEDRPATEAELELLVAPDGASKGQKHFDMKSILKAEKAKGKQRVQRGKKKGKDAGEEETQEDFQIDVKDERFKALHEEHIFAIDPSNPHFKKTKSMAALLEERGKRQHGRGARTGERTSAKGDETSKTQSLQSLVESVKRKSNHLGGRGVDKRRKV
ncbi:hypothetical protein DFH11DRAFT_1558886 [Phellopilus nigrolimitatus]|nr:hypothetical protein DFH11DRAFT_1558886 [Phellopilus nigrolimitatus]